ncbi:MAG TPA: polysaccharide biosynthesis tyrosine autokinase [Bryobacteraceae bacterium]|nr:polysaccharide biosynthesis tyrosine autokinase [Bryobacteraceae bacterium]
MEKSNEISLRNDGGRWRRQVQQARVAVPEVVPGSYYVEPEIGRPVQEHADSAGIAEVMRILWRRKYIIAGLALIGVLAGLVPGLILTPTYRARTSLLLEGFNENYLNMRDITPVSPVVANASAEAYLQNQLKILQSETLAKRVIDKLSLKGKPQQPGWIARLGGMMGLKPAAKSSSPEDDRIRQFLKSLSVRSSLQSQIVEILYDSHDPLVAAEIANTIASEYVTLNRESRWQSVQDATEWLSRQTADLKVKLEQSGQELQDYARSSGLLFTNDPNQGTPSEERMRQMQEALSRAQSDRAAKQSQYETALNSTPETLPEVLDSAPLRQYQTSLVNMQRELAQLLAVYTPSYYKVQKLQADIANLQTTIAKERQNVMTRVKNEYQSAQRYEQLLSKSYGDQAHKVQEQSDKFTHYNMLKREYESTQQLYDSMLQKVKEAGMASALRATNIRLLDPARPPSDAYSPKNSLNCAIGLFAGLLFGVGLVIVREQSDLSVKRPGETRLMNLRELGVIPSANEDPTLRGPVLFGRQSNVPLELVTWHHGPGLLAESFRGALASILFSSGEADPPGVLVFTSVDSMEGKTTVLSNLGIALAETNRRVLLVDADLRRPRLHKVFNVCNDLGLTDLLRSNDPIEKLPLDGMVRHTEIPRVDLLPSGPGVARVMSLLYSSRLPALLQRFRREYDIVLIDTPPMSTFADARVLGRLSDSVVLIVRSGKTSREQLRAMYLQFLEDQTPVHGAILNDWSGSNAGGRYSSYANERYSEVV